MLPIPRAGIPAPVNVANIMQQGFQNQAALYDNKQAKNSSRNKDLSALAQTLMKDPRFKRMLGGLGGQDLEGGAFGGYQPDLNDYMLGGSQYGYDGVGFDVPAGYDL